MNNRRKKWNPQKLWGKSILAQKNLIKILGKKKFGQKFKVQENFGFKRSLIPNEFWVKKMSQIFYCQKRI